MACPVCGSNADQGSSRDYGEQQQFRCVRCGPYIITRTASAMLHSRLEKDPVAYARLSHAIRLQSSDDHLLSISSANLEDLVGEHLPDIPQLNRNLLRWLAAQLDDDRFGHVTLPQDNSLAAIIGAVDDDGVTRLLNHLVKKRLVDRSDDGKSVHLTPDGWDQLEVEKSSKQETSSVDEWDVFICHASEDKEEFARPLAEGLIERGFRVWFDEFTLTVGDNLRRSIDNGLAHSRFGIVVVSPAFMGKEWPQMELDGLVTREVTGIKVILPVWHMITADKIREYSPTLANKVAVSSSKGLSHVIDELIRAIEEMT